MQSLPSEFRTILLEFEAIIMALDLARQLGVERVVIQNDCESALLMAKLLADGKQPAKDYCGISDAARERFVAQYLKVECDVDFQYVRGHVGHPLNETANSIANLSRTAAAHPQVMVEAELWARLQDSVRDLK